jgi:hypothetical protein
MSTSWNVLKVNFPMQENTYPLHFAIKSYDSFSGGYKKVNSHASPPRELVSEESFHILSLFISISNSQPTWRVVPSINTPYVPLRTKFLIIMN